VYELAQSPNAKEEIRKSFLELMSAYSRKTAMSRDFVSKKINSYCVQAGGYQPSDAIGDEEKPTVHIDLSSETAKQAKAEVSGGQTDRWQSSTHIALWLESLGMHQYITSFQQCKIDSVGMLLKITNDDLLDLRVEARHRLANKAPKMHHASARASFSCLESLKLPDFPHPPFRDGPDSAGRETILAQVEVLKKKGDVKESEKFRQPLFELLEARLISPQELQMMLESRNQPSALARCAACSQPGVGYYAAVHPVTTWIQT
jgi:hypothetical protein